MENIEQLETSLGDDMTTENETDEALVQLRDAVDPVFSKFDTDRTAEKAGFVIAAKEVTDSSGEYVGVQTFIDAVGDYGLIQEALYAELMEQIASQNCELFEAFRGVVKMIEEEMGIEDGTSLTTRPEFRVLH